MQLRSKAWSFAAVALASGCLSETLIDNYDATKVSAGEGGASGLINGLAGTPSVSYVPPFDPGLPTFVSVTGGTSSTNPVGKGGTAVATTANSGSAAGTAGDGAAGAPPAASTVPILLAVPNAKHALAKYLAYDMLQVKGYGIKLGVTASDHLIAVVSAWGVAIEAATGVQQAVQAPALLAVMPSGDPLRYVTFSAGRMPDGVAVDAQGAVLFVGKLDRDVSYGGPTIGQNGYGYFVAALDADWVQTLGQGYSRDAEATVHEVAWDLNGGIHLSISEGQSYVVGLEADGRQRYRWDVGVKPAGIAVDALGRVHAAGAFGGTISLGPTELVSSGLSDGWLASYDVARGTTTYAARFGGSSNDSATAVAVAPNGHTRVGGSVSGQADVFGVAINASSSGTPFLCDLDESGQVTWITLLGDAGTVAKAVQQNGRTYVAGHLYGPNVNEPWQGSKLYVAELEPSGTASAMFTIDSSGDSMTDLAVDSLGNIWLSGRANVVPQYGETVVDSIVLLRLVRSNDTEP